MMEKTVLSVSKEVFRAKEPGRKDTVMWRVYMADEQGHVGSLYSNRECTVGEVVQVGLAERDGRLRPRLIWPDKPNI